MGVDLGEWLNLALRWLHLTAGIAWIGSSFYFVWLDNHLKAPASGDASGELWSVHCGGFYHNQKYQVAPSAMPEQPAARLVLVRHPALGRLGARRPVQRPRRLSPRRRDHRHGDGRQRVLH